MSQKSGVSRRGFFGGLAATIGVLGLRPQTLWAQARAAAQQFRPPWKTEAEYDAFAKLAGNENPYGPYESAMEAMNHAFKYANRYGYPDGDIQQAIADHHGVDPSHILLGAGSGEILGVVGMTYLQDHKKVIGVEPSFNSVYRRASGIKADSIKLPLLPDYRQDIPAMIEATKKHYREVGFVYMCNPNNPTGVIVTQDEMRQLVDSIPEDVPILVDEAYYHFVEDPTYATAIPYVLEGRPVIVARTFSKIAGLAAMRLGYAVTTPEIIARMRPHQTGSTNALVRWGAAASLKDQASQDKVKRITLELRKKTTSELERLGFDVIPSETNFFMVDLGRPIGPVRDEFQKKGVLVGRDFPPLLNHLRVSVGTAEEMDRFLVAFKEIFPQGNAPSAG